MGDFESWVDEWELSLASGRRSRQTVLEYVRYVNQFTDWMATNHPTVSGPHGTTRAMCQSYAVHMANANKAEATRRLRLIALKMFLTYVAKEPDSGLDTNPAVDIELPVPKAKPVPVLDDESLTVLLRSIEGTTFVARRDTLIVRLLFDTGLRRAELVSVDVEHVDARRMEVLVTGKGGDQRYVPFGNRTALALRKYLRTRDNHPGKGSAALLLATRLNSAHDWRLQGSGIAVMIDRRCRAAGLGHVHPHQFRHTWAADMKENGVGDDSLERLGGWKPGSAMPRRYGNAVADKQALAIAHRLTRGDRV